MGLEHINSKAKAIFVEGTLNLLTREGLNQNIMIHWLALKCPFLKIPIPKNKPLAERSPTLFTETIDVIKGIHAKLDESQNILKYLKIF